MISSALKIVNVPVAHQQQTLYHAVVEGLSAPRRRLPCRFFYDEAGSLLFERICELPEYYPTRTEKAIIAAHAGEMLAATGAKRLSIVELGSGSSYKTRLLIEAALRRQPTLQYVPIDISGDFLQASSQALLNDYPCLSIVAIAGEYHDALRVLPEPEEPRLFLFLGGNIGNFEFEEAVSLMHHLRCQMSPQDRLLVGMDRVKDAAPLTAAYNDSAGVTAAFNKNLLVRINRELNSDFDLAQWSHAAPFNSARSRIEMWLVSDTSQVVTVGDYRFAFETGEHIHTENSHKYTRASFADLCRTAGLHVERDWSDFDEAFTMSLLRPVIGRSAA